ncbi:MAG: hypothetical protein IKE16_03505 [Solobacterium sp.]|nr:hypothetical protein [Solobacterium sp.]MBR2793690.1 hypothetical protein [Solobacterium sp.]
MSPQFSAFESVIKSFEENLSKTSLITAFIVIALIFAVVILFFHVIIGIGAYREGHGKKGGIGYLAFAVFFLLLCISSLIYDLTGGGFDSTELMITEALIDLTMVCVCIDIIYSAIRTRTLLKQIRNAEAKV